MLLGECLLGRYLPQRSLTERERIHESLSDDRQAAVQIWALLHIEHELGVLDDVDPEAEGQAVPKQRKNRGVTLEVSGSVARPALPVGLPDVKHVWLGDPHGVRLPVQEVEEVLDGVRRPGAGRPPYRSEEVLHKRMQRHLKELKPD